jgi:multiple sugar transport system permease protein
MSFARRYAFGLLGLIVLLAFTAFFFLPILWLIREPSEAGGGYWNLHAFISTFNTMLSWQNGSLVTWLKNSAIYCLGGSALALILSIPAGYGLALTQFVGRRTLLVITLVVMIMPLSALALPLVLEAKAVGLLDTMWSIILPFGLFPFGTYLAYIFFTSAVPKELLAAARVDGAGEWQIFRHIAAPLARPIIALVGYFALVSDWNNFFLPFVMTVYDTPAKYPIQVGLQTVVQGGNGFGGIPQGGFGIPQGGFGLPPGGIATAPWTAAMAALIAAAPVLVVFLFAQRMLVRGMLAGASKG